jgi:hypothetical protein
MEIKYRVTLNSDEKSQLHAIISSTDCKSQKFKRAMVLLHCDMNTKTDQEIADSVFMSRRSIEEIRRRFVLNGFDLCLNGIPRNHFPSIMHGENEARLIKLACEERPEGVRQWSLRVLKEKFCTIEGLKVSHETIRKTLNNADIKPWLGPKEWCIPPVANADFVAHMEDVLDVYTDEPDLAHPLVCMDESPRQLISEVRDPLPLLPGSQEKSDTEYMRNGTAELFMFVAPHLGWRRVEVTEHRTRVDWAWQIKKLVDEDFPEAKSIRLVCDNLNTHNIASLYTAFTTEEAHRIARKLELHYTPKHGSWLNMAEIEFSVLSNTGLKDRIPNFDMLKREVAAWTQMRNESGSKIRWRFTTADARVKLARLYPQVTA